MAAALTQDQITNLLSNIVRDIELRQDYEEELDYLAEQTKFPDLERFIVENLIQGEQSISYVAQRLAAYEPAASEELTKAELAEMVRRIIEIDGDESEIDNIIERLQSNVPHPDVLNLIYWPPEGKDLTPEEIVELALSYAPIPMPPKNP